MGQENRYLTLKFLYQIINQYWRLPKEVAIQQEYYDAGHFCEGIPSPYTSALQNIDHLIGLLKRTRQELQRLQSHTHKWSNGCCIHCGIEPKHYLNKPRERKEP